MRKAIPYKFTLNHSIKSAYSLLAIGSFRRQNRTQYSNEENLLFLLKLQMASVNICMILTNCMIITLFKH